MAEKNSVLRPTSRYVSGGDTEVNNVALEWWERAVIVTADDDTAYVVQKSFEGRIDLIAEAFLSDTRLWWVIAQFNNILDPFAEIKEGTVLYIPSTDRVKSILNGKPGGVPSTREVPTMILPIV